MKLHKRLFAAAAVALAALCSPADAAPVPASAAGTYYLTRSTGYPFYDARASVVTITAGGKFTAKTHGQTVKGKFDASGRAYIFREPNGRGGIGYVGYKFDFYYEDDGTLRLEYGVYDKATEYEGARFFERGVPAGNHEGRYTALLRPVIHTPAGFLTEWQAQGTGHLLIRIHPDGRVVFKGRDPARRAISGSDGLRANGAFRVNSVVNRSGRSGNSVGSSFQGLIYLREQTGVSDGDGELQWRFARSYLPATETQYDTTIEVLVSRYIAPARHAFAFSASEEALADRRLAFSSSLDLNETSVPASFFVELKSGYHSSRVTAPLTQLVIRAGNEPSSREYGLVIGKAKFGGVQRSLFGVIFQKQNLIEGLFDGVSPILERTGKFSAQLSE